MGFELENCCFCIELRTGSLIIGYLSLVGNIILTLMSILGIVAINAASTSIHGDPDQTAAAQTIVGVALIILCIILVMVIVNLIFIIVLLVGLHQDKRGHVKAYLIYNTIFIVLYAIMFFVSLSSGPAAGMIVRDIISLLLSIYFLLVIRSYYLKMDDPSKRPAVYNTA